MKTLPKIGDLIWVHDLTRVALGEHHERLMKVVGYKDCSPLQFRLVEYRKRLTKNPTHWWGNTLWLEEGFMEVL